MVDIGLEGSESRMVELLWEASESDLSGST